MKTKGGEEMMNQEREQGIERFVSREITTCQTHLVENAFAKELFAIDDIENFYRPFDGKLLTPSTCVTCKNDYPCLDSETGTCESCFEDTNEPQEIFEWWIISPWLAKRLLLEGEPILDNDYGVWWGRCTTGQAIAMDYVIQKVYDDLIDFTG